MLYKYFGAMWDMTLRIKWVERQFKGEKKECQDRTKTFLTCTVRAPVRLRYVTRR